MNASIYIYLHKSPFVSLKAKLFSHRSTIDVSAVWQEWLGLNPVWFVWRSSCIRCSYRYLGTCICFSKGFESGDRIDTWLASTLPLQRYATTSFGKSSCNPRQWASGNGFDSSACGAGSRGKRCLGVEPLLYWDEVPQSTAAKIGGWLA